MTRNLYVGGDITRPVRAASGRVGRDALLALGHANHELRMIVDRTDFTVRGTLLAGEIVDTRPDLVGLQEVALWRHGPMQLEPNELGRPNALTVDYDFLQILLADLAARGARYRVASQQQESDLEAPAFLGDPLAGTATEARDVRLTVRDVVLVRIRDGLAVRGSGGGQYRARIDLAVGGVSLPIIRGYAWADIRVGSRRLRFIDTHLESQSSGLAFAQAQELLAGRANRRGTTIIACDCNSDPLNGTIRPGDHVPRNAAYAFITGSGFTDQWLQRRHPRGPGWTSGLGELVNDPTAAGLGHRIDRIFTRSATGLKLRFRPLDAR